MAAISMEYVDGVPLSHARRQKRSRCFGIPEVVPWITSLCDALTYAHETAGMTHRGLGPANMMLDSRAHLKITDFRIAASLRDSLSRGNLCVPAETLHYMSPQQMLGHDPSPADDIYSLGATLYEMLSSKPLFYSGDVVFQAQGVIAPPINQRRVTLGIAGEPIPRHWEETIAACLAKRLEQRPRSAAEVASRLRLGGTVHLTVARDIARPVFQRYVKLGALAAILVALLAVVAVRHFNSKSQHTAVLSAIKKASPRSMRSRRRQKGSGSGKSRDAAKCHAGIGNNPAGRKFRDLSWTGRKRASACDRTAAQRRRARISHRPPAGPIYDFPSEPGLD